MPTSIGFESHDHSICVRGSLEKAQAHCGATGLRLTPVRRRSLEILLAEHRAMGAYDLLRQLAAEGLGSQPPVAYRALEFMVGAGFAHKIEALNAYIACAHIGEDHAPAFLICRSCQSVAETDTTSDQGRLGDAARATGFRIERTVVEAEGLCPACQDEDAE
ncbi:Fur family transcriptional regulator [Sulfitobacter sp. SK012]|uniref:transcriptional repressor n=1 Tax=Sulfitobacter sp. SK012 TaxID=1389005 RepID=UPI000E0A0989|nr:transcriptional repressor [Sulfitobacter sp. SK012]AXI47091.1 Fur family transcriptional regulator [Sulfitobacter sp. SK012]